MKFLAQLIEKIYAENYECTGGDLWSQLAYGAHKIGSQHYQRLAIDLNLFKDGAYLNTTEAHKPFGDFWESLHPMCRWGGRFKDGNHYEFIEWR
jgi:hypothetical protein